MWRQLLGACGAGRVASSRQPAPDPDNRTTPGQRTNGKRQGPDELAFTCLSTISNDSCCSPAAHNCNTATASDGSSSAQLVDSMLFTPALRMSVGGQSIQAISCASCNLTPQRVSVIKDREGFASSVVSKQPSAAQVAAEVCLPAEREAITSCQPADSLLQVALSAYSIRDIAQCDPTMRVRHLKLLSFGPGTVVYKGRWQGLLIAVKLMLYRGTDPGDMQRRVASLLATHCVPQRSHVARVHAFDVSEVVEVQRVLVSTTSHADGSGARGPHQQGGGNIEGGDVSPGRSMLALQPYNNVAEEDGCLCLYGTMFGAADSPDVYGTVRNGSSASPASLRAAGGSRFHFSSVVFCEGSTGAHAGQAPTLQGLLDYLGARPGDFLVHCVMVHSSEGNLWHGIQSGAYDMHGPLGPLGAILTLLHTARGIAQGMHQLHQAGDVHGGLTPSNVLLQWSDAGDDGGSQATAGAVTWGTAARAVAKRRGFTARISDCGMRRLVLGPAWRQQLRAHEELRCCTAPELLDWQPAGLMADGDKPLGNSIGPADDMEWAPSHDVYSFGALLRCMCIGSLQQPDAPDYDAATWPSHVWPPLRSLGEACLAADPAARPRSNEIIKVLLMLEQRLCYPTLARQITLPLGRKAATPGAYGGASPGDRLRVAAGAVAAVPMMAPGMGLAAAAHELYVTEAKAKAAEDPGDDAGAGAGSRPWQNEQMPSRARRGFVFRSMPDVLLRSAPAN